MCSPSGGLLQLLEATLLAQRLRLEEAQQQVLDLLMASERLHQENQGLASDQRRQLEVRRRRRRRSSSRRRSRRRSSRSRRSFMTVSPPFRSLSRPLSHGRRR